ncbi:archaetidylserine decarboxylase [Lysobacter koreensis]|uniref:Phosphatidylserine decarboxylase proenzyme n=1 Tax=Lysobacter koreensis TaxID=266122 RepID=A0ABW2YIF2_9GAMM
MSLITTLTYLLPHRAMSSLARKLAYSTHPRTKQWLIDTVTRKFGVDLSEAEQPDPTAYPSFNAFFTRALKPGARVAEPDANALLMPADGRISECGHIGRADEGVLHEDASHIFQAKGHGFTTAELLGDETAAHAFEGGVYATVYLSPKDYHRVHMPWTGRLRETVHVPGRLFSVGPDAVGTVSKLFARNERLVCHFDTDFGPMAVVMVGALLVSGVETVWGGVEIPPYGGPVTVKDYRGEHIVLERFAEMARFNYGSTVIVLLPRGVAELAPALSAQVAVRLGERLATRIG